jgi:hypothetical protein
MFAPEPLIESLLAPHAPTASADFRGYSNHCQRVFRFCLTVAGERASSERGIYAVATAFHDLGILPPTRSIIWRPPAPSRAAGSPRTASRR